MVGMKKEILLRIIPFYIVESIITGLLIYWLSLDSQVVESVKVTLEDKGIITSFFGLGILAYFLGLRHALDADHLAAIDNSTRKLVQERKSSYFTGLFFSLGHSTVVILLAITLMIATRIVASNLPQLENLGSIIGTIVSGGFLYIIGLLNLLVLMEIYKIYKEVSQTEKINSEELENVLLKRGFMNKFFKGLFKIVDKQYYMYPIGFLFGLGFDTASETALLAISAAVAGIFAKIPLWSLLVFPFLFTAGMTLIDTTDGLFMSGAYQWAFTGNPIRKVWYNLTMTTISILVAYLIGTLELLGLVQSEFNLTGVFWNFIALVNGGVWWGNIGILIVITFATTWIISLIIYRLKISKK